MGWGGWQYIDNTTACVALGVPRIFGELSPCIPHLSPLSWEFGVLGLSPGKDLGFLWGQRVWAGAGGWWGCWHPCPGAGLTACPLLLSSRSPFSSPPVPLPVAEHCPVLSWSIVPSFAWSSECWPGGFVPVSQGVPELLFPGEGPQGWGTGPLSALGHLQHSLCLGQPGASVCVWLGVCVCLSEGVCLGFGGGGCLLFSVRLS